MPIAAKVKEGTAYGLRGSISSSAETSGTWKRRRSLSSLTERLHKELRELWVLADKQTQGQRGGEDALAGFG